MCMVSRRCITSTRRRSSRPSTAAWRSSRRDIGRSSSCTASVSPPGRRDPSFRAHARGSVLARHGAVQRQVPHCYEMCAGPEFARIADERPATFFLTDWLVRNFERAVVRGLGIDRYPELKAVYFQNYTDLLYLAQFPDERLHDKAREIATYLGLPLEVRQTGFGALETRLAELVEAAAA